MTKVTSQEVLKRIKPTGILVTDLVDLLGEAGFSTDGLSKIIQDLEKSGNILVTHMQAPKGTEHAGSFQIVLQSYLVDKSGNKTLQPIGAFRRQRITVMKAKNVKKLKKQKEAPE